jgi:alanyl-tRNA synthetase
MMINGIRSKITRIRKVDSKRWPLDKSFLDTTPFYPEGGTSRDKGTLVSANETIEIIDTKENNDFAFCKKFTF